MSTVAATRTAAPTPRHAAPRAREGRGAGRRRTATKAAADEAYREGGAKKTRDRRPADATTQTSSTALLVATTVAVLNLVGVVMVLSASSVASLTDYGSPWYFFLRQLLWSVVGVVAFVVAIRFDYHRLRGSSVRCSF